MEYNLCGSMTSALALRTQKRSLFNHVTVNNTDFTETEPSKKIMKLDTLEAVAGGKQSTPVKRCFTFPVFFAYIRQCFCVSLIYGLS
ncbi:unnamed protein product [Haemonchus placei]|uniref:Uncharacterized protein n=1 Tax=Haemonchus placei TaxID=6290 RepID=A0A0N4VW53_HAEPC|nr:unnamed protein product [Haemonchus placei]